jgi:hypothetical protein
MMTIKIRQGHEVLVDSFPNCDICTQEGYQPPRKARYDGATRMGPWAYMCTDHWRQYGHGTGVGVGQRLIKRPTS